MNLDYGKEYEDFKKEVESFCREYSGVIITNKKGGALTALNAVDVPIYHIETGKHKPVTAARRFIAENALSAPSVFNVRRNEHTTDRFFWGEKGLFSAQYAEENHFLFPSLKVVVEGIGEEKIFEGLELTADDWEEIEEYEYAFV